jgi:hypothetical protein
MSARTLGSGRNGNRSLVEKIKCVQSLARDCAIAKTSICEPLQGMMWIKYLIPGFHPGLKLANTSGVVARDFSTINPTILAKNKKEGYSLSIL